MFRNIECGLGGEEMFRYVMLNAEFISSLSICHLVIQLIRPDLRVLDNILRILVNRYDLKICQKKLTDAVRHKSLR